MKKNMLILWVMVAMWLPSLLSAQTITPEIISDLDYVTEAVPSPNGDKIAYVKRIPGGENDAPGSRWYELNVMPANGGQATTYIAKPMSANHIAWSADGGTLYFMARRADIDKKNQVYGIRLNGGEAFAVTREAEGVQDFQFSADGKKIALLIGDGKTDTEAADEKKGKDWVVYGENYKYSRLYVYDIAADKTTKLFSENLHVTGMTWSPDGSSIVFKACDKPETDWTYMFQRIYKVSASGGTPAVLVKTEGKLGDIVVSPDSKTLAYAAAVDITDPLPQSLFVVPMSGGAGKNLTDKMEASVTQLAWTSNSEVLMLTTEGCYSALYRVDANSGNRSMVHGKAEILTHVTAVPNADLLVAVGQTPQYPQEVLKGSLKTGKMERVTFHNTVLNGLKMGKQEVIEWKAKDGMTIQGILTLPTDYVAGQKYPLLLQIHGGPEGVSLNGFNTRSVYPVGWYAANGWMVLEPNYRGSQGRGVAFAKADHKDLAGKEFEDVLAGIDDLVKKGMVDNNKVATGGFSYGGYFSAWAATKHSDRFKAAMVGAGITNWISFTGTTDIVYENSYVHWNLWWYDEMKLVWDRSPLAHINNSKTATLVVHGERDDRVPIGQGLELYNAMKLKNIPTEMVMYKRQPHGINERAAQIDYMNRTLNWYNKYTK